MEKLVDRKQMQVQQGQAEWGIKSKQGKPRKVPKGREMSSPKSSSPVSIFFWVQIHYGSHTGLLFPILLCPAVSCACSWLIRDEVILIRPVQAPKVPLCSSQAIAKPSHKLLKTRKQEEPLQSLQEVEQMQSQSQILITRMSGNIQALNQFGFPLGKCPKDGRE